MQTSHPDVYAAGDVSGGPEYVYVAAAGGRVAAENAVKSLALGGESSEGPRDLDLSIVPRVTFTSPQVASVGITEEVARAAGIRVDVSVLEMTQVPRALVAHDARGLVKIVAESGSGRILGVHAVEERRRVHGRSRARDPLRPDGARYLRHTASVPDVGREREARRAGIQHGCLRSELLRMKPLSMYIAAGVQSIAIQAVGHV